MLCWEMGTRVLLCCRGPGIKLQAYFEHVVVSVASGEGVT